MRRKKRDMSFTELHRFLADKYNDYQNASIYDSNYNYLDTEFSEELFNQDLYMDDESRKNK